MATLDHDRSITSTGSRFNADHNGAGFISSLKFGNLTNPTQPPFSGFNGYYDNVADWLFTDPDRGGLGFGEVWDDPGVHAFAYYAGHGANPNLPNPMQSCNTNTDCTAPNPGTTMPGVCILVPTGNYCYYNQSSDIIIDGNAAYQAYSCNIFLSGGLVAWGESPTSGGWDSAGTNGGVNMAILDMSHGTKPMMWDQQLVPAMAGVHMIATILPSNGDQASVADRGQAFGDDWIVNPNGSVANAWINAMVALGENDGGPCVGSDFSQGGGYGLNGCGCNIVVSADTSLATATAHLNENWISVRDDTLDATAASRSQWRALCNYETAAFPLTHN